MKISIYAWGRGTTSALSWISLEVEHREKRKTLTCRALQKKHEKRQASPTPSFLYHRRLRGINTLKRIHVKSKPTFSRKITAFAAVLIHRPTIMPNKTILLCLFVLIAGCLSMPTSDIEHHEPWSKAVRRETRGTEEKIDGSVHQLTGATETYQQRFQDGQCLVEYDGPLYRRTASDANRKEDVPSGRLSFRTSVSRLWTASSFHVKH